MVTRRKGKKKLSAKRWADSQGNYSQPYLKTEGIELFKIDKQGLKKFSILPYTVGNGVPNPMESTGEYYFEHTFYVHANVGPNNKKFLCPSRTLDQPCPICEFQADLAKDPDADKKLVDSLWPKQRQLWNIVDTEEPEKGVQVWDVSYHLFGKQLKFEIDEQEEDDTFDEFADPDDGYELHVKFQERTYKTAKFYEAKSFTFRKRKKPIADEVLEQAHVLDELLSPTDYDEMKRVFEALASESESNDDDDDDEEERKPRKPSKPKRRKAPVEDDEFEDDDEEETDEEEEGKEKIPVADDYGIKVGMEVNYNDKECSVVKISGDGTSLTLEDDESETIRGVGADEVEIIKKKKTPPKKKAATKRKAKAKPEPEEDESPLDDDEDDDEEWDE